jgi:citrate lyase subunit beta / citryl-CoA lyase
VNGMRPRRSLLWVPADQRRKLERAASAGADVVVFDLEDGVATDRKDQARSILSSVLQGVDYGGSERMVRINGSTSLAADLEVAALADALCVPKVSGPDDLATVRTAAREEIGTIPPILAISAETSRGVLSSGALIEADDNVVGWMWGSEDLAGELGILGRVDRRSFPGPLALARYTTAMLAAATGKQAIDTVYPYFKDVDGLRAEARSAVLSGFVGKGLIHPNQVAVVHDAFTPTDEEITRARTIIAAFSDGAGVAVMDGQMLDLPHRRAAERVLQRAGISE